MRPAILTSLFAERRPSDPDRVFLEVPGRLRLTYGDLADQTGRLAHALRTSGVGVGDRVAVQIEKSPLTVLLYLACIRAGAVLVPMNPAYTDNEVAYLLGDAEPRLFVRDPDRTAVGAPMTTLTADASGAGSLADAAAVESAEFEDVNPGPDDLAAIVYTSGTTGRPKGAMLSQRNLASNAATLHRIWGFGPDDVLLHALPVFHVHGLFVATNCVLANGTGMVFLPRFEPDSVLAQFDRCTVMMGVPTYYTRLLAHPGLTERACRTMRLFISGSAPLLATTHDEFRARTGHAILERYGMTETGMLTSNPLDGERRPGTVGRPLPDVEVRVVSPRTEGIGDIEVRGPNVFSGYWRRPDLSASEFRADGFFRTGDVGGIDEDGYLSIVGRSKDVVISGGLNVYPKEIEDVLDQVPGVVESAVVGIPDPDLGEAVVAVVVAEPSVTLDEDELRAAARLRLAGFKVPKRVHIVEALPRNAMGKVEKARLRTMLSTS
jgi:malonyl-CoA/methylmalonyl-CoA synthetase